MKTAVRLLQLFITLIIGVAPLNAATRVLVLSLDEEIDAKAWQHTRRACDEARRTNTRMMVVHMNTYGGAIDAADSIRTAILRLDMPTVAFVDHNAASAGALIALACDSVFMSPGSSMGAATVVDGQGNPMPDKYQAYMSSIMRSTAEHHGRYTAPGDSVARWRRDPALAAGMVRVDSVVSFTAAEAIKVGFADGTAVSVPDVLRQLGVDNPQIENFEPTTTDNIIGFLSSAAVRAMLIMLIIGGIYMEMHTPGFGFAAAVALVAAALYFLPMLLSGTMPAWIPILLVIGIVLIALELFVIPGFGIAGIAGIAAVIVALCASIVPAVPEGESLSLDAVARPIMIVTVGIIAAVGLVAWLTSRHGPKFIRRRSELMLTQDIGEGYIGVDMSPAALVGMRANTLTDLRPSGKITVGDEVYDAVSTGAFIEAGTHVRVVKYENAQLYVEPSNLNQQ